MIEQKYFNDDVPPIINANEPHMACLLLLDISGSMAGEPIRELNEGLNKFKSDVCQDKATQDLLDIAIVVFNDLPRVEQEFVPVGFMKPVNLAAGGGTEMAPAITQAIEMVNERSRFYRRSGTQPYKPWIIMISDGYGGNVDQIANTIHDMEKKGKLKFFSLGVEGYDPKVLHQLSGEKVMKLKGYDFTGFFDWIHKSMRSISESAPSETPKGIPLPESVDKDTTRWME
ncbi:vWA domain-containing protein [Flexilinea flocculi]|uniref:Uncharacterized conserved protein YegL, contains vWA domain of TerY type n=1 Tax=Flexilinea flocculi TaxID=1678840 RepID=A0A0S7BIQ0_9CHLR|nr:VWA domain-containing protein [Flexilinea flocculi]NMC35178.1 VWA domain-containing protein [Veillonellaceae bacterium]GAP40234.1 uncharacterized conserved protein YegL, contains vWA domain of TerY type [Flexilinea flocculi]